MILREFQKSKLLRAADSIAASLLAAKLGLYQTLIDIAPDTPLATFTAAIATYAGYATATLTWGTPSVADDGTVESLSASVTFRPTDAVTPNAIYGLWIMDSTSTFLLFAGQFDGAPLPMQSALQIIRLTVRFRPADNTTVVELG